MLSWRPSLKTAVSGSVTCSVVLVLSSFLISSKSRRPISAGGRRWWRSLIIYYIIYISHRVKIYPTCHPKTHSNHLWTYCQSVSSGFSNLIMASAERQEFIWSLPSSWLQNCWHVATNSLPRCWELLAVSLWPTQNIFCHEYTFFFKKHFFSSAPHSKRFK